MKRIVKGYSQDVIDVKKGSQQILKVYRGSTLLWEHITQISFSPNEDTKIGPAPQISANFTATNSGNIYIEGYATGYIEISWKKNGVNQGYFWIFDGANYYYPNGRTFAINDGDILQFTYGGPPGSQGTTEVKYEDSNGDVILTSIAEI